MNSSKTLQAIAILCWLSFSATISAAPKIITIDTSNLSNNRVTITGSGFGAGPTVNVHDDFEHNGASTGLVIDGNQAITGAWTVSSTKPSRYDDIALSGKHSAMMWSKSTSSAAPLRHNFTKPVQSVYMSYWVSIPPGYPFPGSDTSISGGFPKPSCWKFTWLIDQDYRGNSSDLAVPTYTGSGNVFLAGNDGNIAQLPKVQNWWSWGKWMRLSFWLHADPKSPSSNGRIIAKIWSDEFGDYTMDVSDNVFDADGPTTKQYQYINIPGWIKSFASGNGRPLYDDIYIASGPNAYARVELTDSTSYASSKKFAIQKIISWSDTSITFKTIASNIPDITKAAIHVFAGDTSRASSGTSMGAATSSPTPKTNTPTVSPPAQIPPPTINY